MLDVIVSDEQLSLAIGKRGQNVRLASRLLGCRIEIKSEEAVKDEVAAALAAMLRQVEGRDGGGSRPRPSPPRRPSTTTPTCRSTSCPASATRCGSACSSTAISHAGALAAADPAKLMEIPGIGPHSAAKLIAAAKAALAAQAAAGAEE